MQKNTIQQILVVASVILTVVVNGLANALPLNGQETGAISDRFAIYFVPAGYVFSIWGLIYLGLLAFTVYQALPAQRDNARLAAIRMPFIVSSLANTVWVFLWHYEQFPATVAVMLLLLASLITVYLRLGIGRVRVSPAERWAVRVPFSIYLGWITVATVANVTQLLYFVNWGGWGIAPQAWAAIMLGVAVIVGALMARTRRDVAYLGVLVWAFIGIALKHAAAPVVATSAWAATAVIGALIVLLLAGPVFKKGPALA